MPALKQSCMCRIPIILFSFPKTNTDEIFLSFIKFRAEEARVSYPIKNGYFVIISSHVLDVRF